MMKKIKRMIKKIGKQYRIINKCIDSIQAYRRKRYYKKMYQTMKVDDKLVIFEAFLGKQFACSPKALYEAMLRDEYFKDFIFVWVFRNPAQRRMEFTDHRTVIVKYNSRRYFRYYARAKYWITNWRLSDAIIKKDNQILIQTWHGTPLKKIGMDLEIEGNATTSQKKGHAMYLNDAKKYDYFISPSAFCTKVFASAFGLNQLNKQNILIETGYPRNDFLFRYTEEDVRNLKKELHLPENKKIILYAPTWRDNQHQLGVGYTFDASKYINDFLESISDDYMVILRLHYLVANQLDLSAFKGKAIDYSRLDDINRLYVVSDMLVTDYSSVFFDYANLNRPILFYMYDLDEYQSNVRDFYIDLKELPGPIVKNERELLHAIYHIDEITDKYKERYQKFKQTYNYLDDKDSGKRVIDICVKGERA